MKNKLKMKLALKAFNLGVNQNDIEFNEGYKAGCYYHDQVFTFNEIYTEVTNEVINFNSYFIKGRKAFEDDFNSNTLNDITQVMIGKNDIECILNEK